MTYTDGGVMYFTIFEYLKEPEGIGALVDRRKASGPTGEPGYVLVTETTLRLANGQNAPALDWVDPIKQFYFTEVFAESSTAFVVLSVAGSADALNFYGSAVTDAILTFCTE
ncbi:MAG: hypothetical protein HZB38_06185 [Planctomycetes bacterium]|nr:hypothetical protein [Planctomycetota bacterium]